MNSELFNRLKKLSEKEGQVILVENDEAFVLMPLDEYENFSGGECECDFCEGEDADNEIEEVAVKDEAETTDDDKELLKKVNEDIAKWRAEQEQSSASQTSEKPFGFVAPADAADRQEHKNIKTQEQEENILSAPSDIVPQARGILEDEERYYLEPLE
jgi:hypothetical protein